MVGRFENCICCEGRKIVEIIIKGHKLFMITNINGTFTEWMEFRLPAFELLGDRRDRLFTT